MNYAAHYQRLIDRARDRVLAGYAERHHVIPRCMGGTNAPGNLVRLTAEEHYVAHQLLVKMHPEVWGLAWAAVKMARQCSGNKAYGWLRRRHAKALRVMNLGRRHSAETRAKLSLVNPRRSLTAEDKAKMLAGRIGKPLSAKNRLGLSRSRRGMKFSATHRANISAAQKGVRRGPPSADTRTKLSASQVGRVFTPEHRAKLSAAAIARWQRT